MANLTTAAGGNGVAGNVVYFNSTSPFAAVRTVTGTYGSTYGDNNDLAVSDNHAVRRSVSRTHGGATASGVFSETQCFRTAYAGVEADSPKLDASRTAA
jgi:hypothetical protein